MSEGIQRIKLCEDVANHIIEHIRSQKWAVGTRLPSEPELAQLFDVSRSTVRAAVRSLQVTGVLRTRSGSGTYVADAAPLVLETRELAAVMANAENVYSLVQARYILEPQLAALAAKNVEQHEIAELFDILHDMEQHTDRHLLMAHGHRFHESVARFSHNEVLYGFYQSAASSLRGLRVLDSLTLTVFLEGIDEHRAIANAIAAHDDALAKALMRSHLKKDYANYLKRAEILE